MKCMRCDGDHDTKAHPWTLLDEPALRNGAVSDVNPDPAANWRILYELKCEQVYVLAREVERLREAGERVRREILLAQESADCLEHGRGDTVDERANLRVALRSAVEGLE